MLMSILKARKIIDAINKGIAVNPTTFIVEHIEKVEVDGAFEDVSTTVTYTGIIYLEDNNNKINIDIKTMGTEYSTDRYKMILNNESKIIIDEKNKIEFNCNEGHMKVTGAYPIYIENILCGYLCDIERM